MDYNEYDGNGNKNRFNLKGLFGNKDQRSRVLAIVYILIFVVIIIIVRFNVSNLSSNNKNSTFLNNENTLNNTNIENSNTSNNNNKEVNLIDNNNDSELDKAFSFIDLNNYNFVFETNISNTVSLIEGKRFNDKYSFELKSNNQVLYFNGTSNYIKAKETPDGESKLMGFPYVLVNIFNNNTLKNIINSSKLEDNVYVITNEELAKAINYDKMTNNEKTNTIELHKNNNKITKIVMNLTNAISSYLNEETTAILTLNYSNFGLVDDFLIE